MAARAPRRYPEGVTAPAQPTSDTGTLAALALGLVQRADRRRPLTDPQVFGAAADRLAAAPAFDVSAAETAAIFLDLQATQAIRAERLFGGRRGAALMLLTFALLSATAPTPLDRWIGGAGVLASLLALAALVFTRALPTAFTQAGALLTAAVTRAPQASTPPVPLDIDVRAVQRRVDQQRIRIQLSAWLLLALLGLTVVLRVAAPWPG